MLRAPELGLPVVFFELDRGTMKESLVAAKTPCYLDYLTRTVRTSGGDVLHWQRLYGRPDHDADEQHPPIALVFDGGTRLGITALHNRIDRIGDLTSAHWSPLRPYREAQWEFSICPGRRISRPGPRTACGRRPTGCGERATDTRPPRGEWYRRARAPRCAPGSAIDERKVHRGRRLEARRRAEGTHETEPAREPSRGRRCLDTAVPQPP